MRTISKAAVLGLFSMAIEAQAGSMYHRLIWDSQPDSQATVGFTPNGGSDHHIEYGLTTDMQSWTRRNVTARATFDRNLDSQFVRLTGLPANSAVYYRVCDSRGCSDPFWFRTAPSDDTPFTAIAGGDTRTGWTNRQEGNELVAKIRPLFVMHGGDFTNDNDDGEMEAFLRDWQLSFSDDQISGVSYKRIYPLVVTHGNHEDDNYSTLCEVFGADYDQNGRCNPHDTYGAFNVSPLLRVYTLNSQFQDSGWSSYARSMNNWLEQDLEDNGDSAKWRIAQYHKPLFPHYTGKRDNRTLFDWWADLFYQHKMNLVVESDTHIAKLTEALRPSGRSFSATENGGTVFVGEGSWGAPARSANDPKSWTIDLASIQQFKVLSVSEDKMEVRTAQFDSRASTLSRAQRSQDPLLLPNNVEWWYATSVGDVLNLVQNGDSRTVIDTGDGPDDPVTGGDTIENISASRGEWRYYSFTLPAGVNELTVRISGGSGDADLYVRQGSRPTSSRYNCRPYRNGNSETCNIDNPAAGEWHVGLRAYNSFSGVTLTYQYE